jgi:predicted site-specific integrase-resolvase
MVGQWQSDPERSAQRVLKVADQILKAEPSGGGPLMRAAVYARVSTLEQEPENQLQELRRYVQARDWTAVEYVDRGVSGAKDRRPSLDQLLTDARRRRFDVLVCWRSIASVAI